MPKRTRHNYQEPEHVTTEQESTIQVVPRFHIPQLERYGTSYRILNTTRESELPQPITSTEKHIVEECAICYDPLRTNTITLPCNHTFHEACIDGMRGIPIFQGCPLCRNPLPLTEEQQRHQLLVEYNLQVLRHIGTCLSGELCRSDNCARLKSIVNHVDQCRGTHGCRLCTRFLSLLKLHSHDCYDQSCTVPFCLRYQATRARRQAMYGLVTGATLPSPEISMTNEAPVENMTRPSE
jgi:hypothetical protein